MSEGLLGEQRGCLTTSSAGLVRTEPGRVHLLDDRRSEATKHVVGLARGERPWLVAMAANKRESGGEAMARGVLVAQFRLPLLEPKGGEHRAPRVLEIAGSDGHGPAAQSGILSVDIMIAAGRLTPLM